MKNKSKKAIELHVKDIQSAIAGTQKIINAEIARVKKYQSSLEELITLLNKLR